MNLEKKLNNNILYGFQKYAALYNMYQSLQDKCELILLKHEAFKKDEVEMYRYKITLFLCVKANDRHVRLPTARVILTASHPGCYYKMNSRFRNPGAHDSRR